MKSAVQIKFTYLLMHNRRRIIIEHSLHSVVEKGIKGDLWGRLRVHLWPRDIQDERFGVLEVSYLSYTIKTEGKTRCCSRISHSSLFGLKIIFLKSISKGYQFHLIYILLKPGVEEPQVMCLLKQAKIGLKTALTRN